MKQCKVYTHLWGWRWCACSVRTRWAAEHAMLCLLCHPDEAGASAQAAHATTCVESSLSQGSGGRLHNGCSTASPPLSLHLTLSHRWAGGMRQRSPSPPPSLALPRCTWRRIKACAEAGLERPSFRQVHNQVLGKTPLAAARGADSAAGAAAQLVVGGGGRVLQCTEAGGGGLPMR